MRNKHLPADIVNALDNLSAAVAQSWLERTLARIRPAWWQMLDGDEWEYQCPVWWQRYDSGTVVWE